MTITSPMLSTIPKTCLLVWVSSKKMLILLIHTNQPNLCWRQIEKESHLRDASWLDTSSIWPVTSISPSIPWLCIIRLSKHQRATWEVEYQLNVGNFVKIVTIKDEDMNLHAWMDSMAGEQQNGVRPERPLTQEGWNYLKNLAANITQQFPPSSFTDAQIASLDPHEWTIESYNAAV